MKKLIVLSLVFALLASAAFAVDLSGHIIGTANLIEGTSKSGDKVRGEGTLNRVRIDGSGQANDNFGGYIRAEGGGFTGNAWWKPIDQIKLLIGGNGGDGFNGKEGITGWGFIGAPADTGVTFGGAHVWGGGALNDTLTTRYVFFEGNNDGGEDVYLFITPMDMLSINIQIPFISQAGKEAAEVFMRSNVQVDFKMDGIGEIALTYAGGYTKKASNYVAGTDTKGATVITDDADPSNQYYWDGSSWQPVTAATGTAATDNPGAIHLYYGNTFGPIGIDFGFAYHFPGVDSNAKALGVGLGVKYATDTFGVKLRAVASLAGKDKNTNFLVDVLPYFNLSDKVGVNLEAGIDMSMPNVGNSNLGWHVNPYIRVGEEWGAQFLAGVKLWSNGKYGADADGGKAVTNWAVPIALIVSF